MRLKSIKLAGFKSFVDSTTVQFPSNLTCVVGPNGCGKSNIIDAVRWVLGESSAKNLRGDSMADVIFNGSNSRKPVGQASIELVFDNSDAGLGGEYAGFTEIAIKRQVVRDGSSSYFLNGTKCRRRDITDIFLGTGLGPRSYAIIEQGTISRLIDAKPEELRVFIEEAAGISKYKERRKETESRMKRTRENLARLNDILEELDRQLQHLKRQSISAEKYKEFKQEERLLKAQLITLKWQNIQLQVSEKNDKISQYEIEFEKEIAGLRSTDAAIEKYRVEHLELTDSFNHVQERFYRIGAEITRQEDQIQYRRQRVQQLSEDLKETDQNQLLAQREVAADEAQIQILSTGIVELEPELKRLQSIAVLSNEEFVSAELAMQNWQTEWDAFNEQAAEPRQQSQVEQSRIEHLEQAIQRLHDRMSRLKSESESLSAGPIEQEIEELQCAADESSARHEELHAKLNDLQSSLGVQRDMNNQQGKDLDGQRQSLQQLRGRHASLEALQQAALGQTGTGTVQWLIQQGLDKSPRLAEDMKVDSGWETAVETVLGDSLQAISVGDMDTVAGVLESLEQGSVMVVENREASAIGESGTNEFLFSKVSSKNAAISTLLTGVKTADSLEQALIMRKQLASNESVITPEGIWIGASWLRVSRDEDANAGVLQRQQELESVSAQLLEIESEVHFLESKVDEGREQTRELEQSREGLQNELEQVGRQQSEVKAQLSAKQVRLEQFVMRTERLEQEKSETEEHLASEKENLSQSRLLLQDALEIMGRDTERQEKLLQARDKNRSELDAARQKSRHDKDFVHQSDIQIQSQRTQLESVKQALSRLLLQSEQLEERKRVISEGLHEAENPIEEMGAQLEELLESKLVVEDELTEARCKLESVEHDLRENESKRHTFEQASQQVRNLLEQQKMQWQGLEVRSKTLQEQLLESQFTLEQLKEEMPEEANESEWELLLEKIGNRISRLGAINLAAIDEYHVESNRKIYLDAQNCDLTEALETLESAIKKIDRETRNRFKETYDKLNNGLQELFPKVFGGGQAYLELTGDDLLDTGVTIMARPPGKRNSTIHQLSGGEKALTSIALVFSIFRLNPAPFCMLDEVDAPLDDANVTRYSRLVEEMSESVQFIYISHNKVAMEMAHSLMGVTMSEPGVSRIVSVDVDEATTLAAV